MAARPRSWRHDQALALLVLAEQTLRLAIARPSLSAVERQQALHLADRLARFLRRSGVGAAEEATTPGNGAEGR